MEEVREVYHPPYDPRPPQVCLDEASKQLLGETREPLPLLPGLPRREDYEYERHGTSNLFMLFDPLSGRRRVKVTARWAKVDLAQMLREIVDVDYPEAEVVVIVMDNLNTHTLGALYEAFEPAEALRIARRLEIHYTPKHGSWLNMAEIELSVLARQCLRQRIPDVATLVEEVAAWEQRRNQVGARTEWRFTTEDARIKLRHLYPSLQP